MGTAVTERNLSDTFTCMFMGEKVEVSYLMCLKRRADVSRYVHCPECAQGMDNAALFPNHIVEKRDLRFHIELRPPDIRYQPGRRR